MADMQKVHSFAEKWCNKSRDQNINYLEQVDHFMADDCEEIEFKMDCGNAFTEKYKGAFNNCGPCPREEDEVEQHITINPEDRVDKITVDYHRVTRINPKQPVNETMEYVTGEYATGDYSEQLIVDRKTESIEYIQNIGNGCKVCHKYQVEVKIKELLDDLDVDYLFKNIEGNPANVIEKPNETKDYTITLDFKRGQQRVIQGTYDKRGLPDDWADFAEAVFNFMSFYGFGEILDPSVYGKDKRCQDDLIFCSVTFDEGYKSYYYISDDDSIEVGDLVLVPAGKDNHTTIVEVINVEYFSKDNTPLPVEKTKHIIRKYTDDDFDLPKENVKEELKGSVSVEEKKDGSLVVSIEDYHIRIFDGMDYEATYTLDKENTQKLKLYLQQQKHKGSMEEMIISEFGLCLDKKGFSETCKKNAIQFEVHTWIS